MKDIIEIIIELLRIFKVVVAEVKKKKNEEEVRDVRAAIKEVDLNRLRDIVLGSK